jgi:large subunit ribosomal protein L17
VSTAHKLVDEIAPKLGGRDSGHLRVKRTTNRRGDNAEMARVSFVDDLKVAPVAKNAVTEKLQVEKAESKKPVTKTEKTPAKEAK